MRKRGILTTFKTCLERHRIGELLVAKGLITPQELRKALNEQQKTSKQLGQIFLERAIVSKRQLALVLFKQTALRSCAALMLFMLSFTSVGAKKAKADMVKDLPSQVKMVNVSADFARVSSYPALYGMEEKRSTNLTAFTKWTTLFSRFERQMKNESSAQIIREWQENLQDFRGLSIKAMADRVNDLVNEKRYILDKKNWGKSDYWATPVEFLERGGDCEDFAIAKYTALRALGVPEERLRVAIVQDTKKNIPHAVLVVYTERGAYILDNQIKSLVNAERAGRYRPIYSINRQAWWLHSTPTKTIIASAE